MAESDPQRAPATGGDFTDTWDPDLIRRIYSVVGRAVKGWHRSEVRGLDRFPPGAALVVSNHSGGLLAMDIPVLATDFFKKFGYDRPLYCLGHDGLFHGRMAGLMVRTGMIRATPGNAEDALRSGAVVVVFPGGDLDAFRPTLSSNAIDFDGRTGYVKTALRAGVPIVPAVSIGGQENQLYLTRGRWLAHRNGFRRLLRAEVTPITVGVPFGPSMVLPLNVPLPTKIVTELLEPIDIVAEFGDDPDIAVVDAHIRKQMQSALDHLAQQRRWPVLG